MYAVVYETLSLIYHAKLICYVCNRCLLSLSLKLSLQHFLAISCLEVLMKMLGLLMH